MKQLDLFEGMEDMRDTRPLPIIVASEYGFPLQSQMHEGKTYYAVLDWVRGVARSNNPSRLWSDLKTLAKKAGRDTYDSIVTMPYVRSDKRRYPADYADEQTLYQIVQYMRAETGIRDQIVKFLAKAGVVLDTVRRDKRAAEQHINEVEKLHDKVRKDSIEGRNDFTATLQSTHITRSPNYAAVTQAEYEELFGAGKRELCRLLAIPDDSRALRENLNTYALLALTTAEVHAAGLMRKLGRKLTTVEQIQIARQVCTQTRPFFDEIAEQAGTTLTSKKVTS